MAYERKCKNWLKTFGEWTLPRCESPETFVFWSGLFILSSALRRQVKVGKKYLGSWECPPHLYIMLIGDAGKVRKTTAAGFGVELLDEITFLKKGPTIVTQASLMTKLTESPDASIYLISEEFSDLIMKSGEDMFQFLTSLFDGKKSIEAATVSRGIEFASRPCVNMIAATTPQWVASHMPENIIGGGFASRVIFIQEERVRQRRMYYRDVNAAINFEAMKTDLLADLTHIAESLSGDFELDQEAMDFMEEWYQQNAEGESSDYRLSGYYQRRPAHIHKVAMLLHIAQSDELVLHKHDFENAIQIVSQIEKNLPKVFEGVGKNPYTFDITRIKNHIIACEPISHGEILSAFQSAAEPWRLEQLLKSLVVMDEVITFRRGEEVLYASTKYQINLSNNGKKPFDPNDIETWNN
jgi:hypothetical protein